VRKEFGYAHIHRRHAARFDTYCREYLNPFLNFHRPCLFATELADPKKPGRIKPPSGDQTGMDCVCDGRDRSAVRLTV
jgi:hypothetical protein